MQFRVEVGLLVLSLAFVVSFFGGLGVGIDLSEYWRLVAILEANPQRYLEYIRDSVLFLILPPAAGLAFSIIAFMKERKSPTGVLKWWLPLAVFGGFFLLWGAYGLQWRYTRYCDAIRGLNMYGPQGISGLILAVYATASVGGILWILAGILFILSPVFKMTLRNNMERKAPPRQSSSLFVWKGYYNVSLWLKRMETLQKARKVKINGR